MNLDAILGLLLVLMLVAVAVAVTGRMQLRRQTRNLVLAGLGLRIAGALLYLGVMNSFYNGGDYIHYFENGAALAGFTADPAAPSLFNLEMWTSGKWWGTSFATRLTGLLLLGIGPTMVGASIVFAIAGYVGILAIALAFHRSFPEIPVERYLVWVVLFPSLWFWPAVLGKDAVVLFGVGLATLGYVGRGDRFNWLLALTGIAVVFAIRPQVAATLVFALASGQLLSTTGVSSWTRAVQGLVVLVLGGAVVALSGDALGVEMFNADEIEGYLNARASQSSIGGSSLAVEGSGVSPLEGFINTLFRPFLWEARGVTALLASAEMIVAWSLVWARRRSIAEFAHRYWRTRLFWMAMVFVLAYATALGMALGNIGTIARQRVHLLPFIFILFVNPPGFQREPMDRSVYRHRPAAT